MGLTILELASQYSSPFQNDQLLRLLYFSQGAKQVISVFVMLNSYYQVDEFFSEIDEPKW